MTSILRNGIDKWNYLFTEALDQRTKGWFMVGSPLPVIILLIAYHRFVKVSGPNFMKNRKPFNIDKIIQIYNIAQVVVCAWMSIERGIDTGNPDISKTLMEARGYKSFLLTYGPFGSYSWSCQPMDTSLSPTAVRVAELTWGYYMLKLVDLLDTVFFVLRKKNSQITFLHVYHHIGVVTLGYIGAKYYPDGQGFFIVPLNCFVHSIMYFYYFLTNYNPEYKKNIWWKKHITQIQIIQFFLLTVHTGKVFFMNCGYPLLPVILFLPQNLLITLLFANFYVQTYIKPNKPVKSS